MKAQFSPAGVLFSQVLMEHLSRLDYPFSFLQLLGVSGTRTHPVRQHPMSMPTPGGLCAAVARGWRGCLSALCVAVPPDVALGDEGIHFCETCIAREVALSACQMTGR